MMLLMHVMKWPCNRAIKLLCGKNLVLPRCYIYIRWLTAISVYGGWQSINCYSVLGNCLKQTYGPQVLSQELQLISTKYEIWQLRNAECSCIPGTFIKGSEKVVTQNFKSGSFRNHPSNHNYCDTIMSLGLLPSIFLVAVLSLWVWHKIVITS